MEKLEWYRPNVALVIEKAQTGMFLICRRQGSLDWWQFPQGGVDEHEELIEAVHRECYEEIGLKNLEIVTSTKEWLTYDFPPQVYKSMRNNGWKYVGQKQKYFHLRFYGDDKELNFSTSHEVEFDAYLWVSAEHSINRVVDFKRKVYRSALTELKLIK